jgi:hypothetical protein
MSMRSKKTPEIKLEYGAPDRLLPADFKEILTQRYFPVLSLTYIASVMGIAASKGRFVHYMFEVKTAYVMALFVALWVSVPAILWIILRGSHLFNHVADDWYKIIAGIMTITLMMSYILFPEADFLGLRLYFAASLPIFVVMYLFFVKGGLPPLAAHPLSALGLTFLLYGAGLGLWH